MLRREFLYRSATLGATAMSWALLPPMAARAAERDLVEVTLQGGRYRYPANTGASFEGLAFNGRVPGPVLRVRHGQTFRARYLNRTGRQSAIHWHGMILPNDMDGVPGITQPPIPDGGEFTYTFKPGPPGLRWYHSHVEPQSALGLFGAFVIEDPSEARADLEVLIVLHDVPDMDSFRAAVAGKSTVPMNMPPGVNTMAAMRHNGGMSGAPRAGGVDRARMPEMAEQTAMSDRDEMSTMPGKPAMAAMPGMMDNSGMAAARSPTRASTVAAMPAMGDEVAYLAHCVGGAAYPHTRPIIVKPGQSVRLRILNTSPTLTHYLRLAGHKLRVTHSDGNPMARAVTVDALRIGVAERYDAWFEVGGSGSWLLESLMADTHDRRQSVVIRTADAAGHAPQVPPPSLAGAVLFDYPLAGGVVSARDAGKGPHAMADVLTTLTLGGGGARWTIDDKVWPHTPKIQVRRGERVAIHFNNTGNMDHPMHLHGHVFELVEVNGKWLQHPLPKDTALVGAGGTATWRFAAAAPPGRWLLHCHNAIHMAGGMATEVDYLGA